MEKVVKQTNQELFQQYLREILANQLITMDDLQQFKEQLFKELESLLKPHASLSKKWLKSHEVKRLLKISAGTLQNLLSFPSLYCRIRRLAVFISMISRI